MTRGLTSCFERFVASSFAFPLASSRVPGEAPQEAASERHRAATPLCQLQGELRGAWGVWVFWAFRLFRVLGNIGFRVQGSRV